MAFMTEKRWKGVALITFGGPLGALVVALALVTKMLVLGMVLGFFGFGLMLVLPVVGVYLYTAEPFLAHCY